MKIYYIYSDYYDQDWIDHIENIQSIAVFRNKNEIMEAIKYCAPAFYWDRFEIFKQGESSKLIDHEKHFNIVFAVQALE